MDDQRLDKLEVEMKFPVVDFQGILDALQQLGVAPGPPVEQTDHYFNHPSRDFAVTDEAIRVRRVGPSCYLTYKGPKLDPATKSRREIEIRLGQTDEAEQPAFSLLEALGFRPAASVRKTRCTAHLHWENQDFEIVLDEVTGLGTFVELETQADPRSLATRRESLQRLAERLGLGRSERRSYLEMLLA
jgi:adenylate cyclase, class 2